MSMPIRIVKCQCQFPGCDKIVDRRPGQLRRRPIVFCGREHATAYSRSKIIKRTGRTRGVLIERPCSCGCGRMVSRTPCEWRKSDKQNGGPVAYYEIQCHNKLLNVSGRVYENRPGPKEKRETRKCIECGDDVTRRPCEFDGDMAFCDNSCANIYRNKRRSEERSITKICANPSCSLPNKEFKVRMCEDFRLYCSRDCQGKDPSPEKIAARRAASLIAGTASTLSQGGHPSSQEFLLRDAMIAANIPHLLQKFYGVGTADFLVNGFLYVFVDGDYWHNYPDGTEKDHRQEVFMRSNGIKFLRLWEHEINEDMPACIAKIKKAMEII